jgi:hypothetical protein
VKRQQFAMSCRAVAATAVLTVALTVALTVVLTVALTVVPEGQLARVASVERVALRVPVERAARRRRWYGWRRWYVRRGRSCADRSSYPYRHNVELRVQLGAVLRVGLGSRYADRGSSSHRFVVCHLRRLIAGRLVDMERHHLHGEVHLLAERYRLHEDRGRVR